MRTSRWSTYSGAPPVGEVRKAKARAASGHSGVLFILLLLVCSQCGRTPPCFYPTPSLLLLSSPAPICTDARATKSSQAGSHDQSGSAPWRLPPALAVCWVKLPVHQSNLQDDLHGRCRLWLDETSQSQSIVQTQ